MNYTEWYSALARYCAYRERCSQEVRDKLLSINVPKEEWDGIFAQLKAENFLNDQRYACCYARGKFRINHWGKVKIKAELRKSGISSKMIENAMKEIQEDEYLQTIGRLAGSKFKELSKDTKLRREQKLLRYLLQKGYEYDLLQEFIREKTGDSQ